jgi:hypothetical protein
MDCFSWLEPVGDSNQLPTVIHQHVVLAANTAAVFFDAVVLLRDDHESRNPPRHLFT